MVSDFSIGTLLAFGAATFFGVHTSFAKTKSVTNSGVAISIYNIYFLIGAAITCFIEYFIMLSLGTTIEFTYLGIICAFLLLCFEVFLLLSIQLIGVGYATGFSVFSSAVITPILQVILGQPIAVWWIMVIGLAMLAMSVFFMSILRDALKLCGLSTDPANATKEAVEIASELAVSVDESTPLVESSGQVPSPATDADAGNNAMKISRCDMILGLVFSSLAGIFMAVLPLPSLYAGENAAGLSFFLSFGVGCVIVIPLSGVITVFTVPRSDSGDEAVKDGDKETNANRVQGLIPFDLLYKLVTFDDEVWHFKQVVIPAVSAGIVWGVGNICGFCSFMYLSYTIAVCFVQCNVIMAMLLGVLLWKEVTDKVEILMLAFLSLVLVGGCAVVVYGVFGSF